MVHGLVLEADSRIFFASMGVEVDVAVEISEEVEYVGLDLGM